MSSFKVITRVETVDDFGIEASQSWVSETGSLDNVMWVDALITQGATKYVWNPIDWADFKPSSCSKLVMTADGDLDVEMTTHKTPHYIREDTIISVDTYYQGYVYIVPTATVEVIVGVTMTVGDGYSEYNSFRLVEDTPFVLGSNLSYKDHAATTDAAFGGTLDVIGSIMVSEPSTASVNLTMIMSN